MDPAAFLVFLFLGFVAFLALVLVVKNSLYVCQPNEVLVFSGRRRRTTDGREVGYRIIKGGRAFRVPILESVSRMDLTNMIIEVTVRNAYSKGGIPLVVQGVANIKVPGEEPLIHNALERFLGRDRNDIMRVARETLEGNLRGVLALLTPEQVNQDKEAFAMKLAEEAEHDLNRIGLVLDTLKIQNVTDEVGYLDALGRMRSAEVRRRARVAEAEAQAEAAEVKWQNHMQAEVAKLDAEIQVARQDNERRITDARSRREALIAEQQAEVQAALAQARAEVQMQEARIDQVRLQLQADVVEPAEAQKEEAIAQAKAQAALIVEEGRAQADVLREMATTYRQSGEAGRDILLMQKLVPLFDRVSGTIGDLRVDRMTVLGSGSGEASSKDGSGGLARGLVRAAEQVRVATGVDVVKALQEKFGVEGRSDAPSLPASPRGPEPRGDASPRREVPKAEALRRPAPSGGSDRGSSGLQTSRVAGGARASDRPEDLFPEALPRAIATRFGVQETARMQQIVRRLLADVRGGGLRGGRDIDYYIAHIEQHAARYGVVPTPRAPRPSASPSAEPPRTSEPNVWRWHRGD